ncbi:MAG: hypothetical protein GY874_17415 [Desulfobacteraceae bacterium]|nr:hypothetical protein [Desulfobacteraceae bacterium]
MLTSIRKKIRELEIERLESQWMERQPSDNRIDYTIFSLKETCRKIEEDEKICRCPNEIMVCGYGDVETLTCKRPGNSEKDYNQS